MPRATQAFSTGLKILSGADVPVYTIEYLTSTRKHKQGDFEKIVVPYIELGRHSDCVIAFGEDCPTVSRKHAAITRNGKEVMIKNLSTTNPTLVNGRPVTSEYFLNSGDEIQLSMEGPRLRYNTSSTGTAKMGFTNRMNLVIQQAIKPYKATMAVIVLVFLSVSSVLGYMAFRNSSALAVQQSISRAQADSIARMNATNKDLVAKVQNAAAQLKDMGNKYRKDKENAAQELQLMNAQWQSKMDSLSKSMPVDISKMTKSLERYVLAIYLTGYELDFGGEVLAQEDFDPECECTGFLLSNGNFVTARHCIDLFMEEDFPNFYSNSGGSLLIKFKAASFDNQISISFTNADMTFNKSLDTLYDAYYDDMEGTVRTPNFFNGTDWAYLHTNYTEGLTFDTDLSYNLQTAEKLFSLGYGDAMRFREDGDMHPYFSSGQVKISGIHNGLILGSQGGERHGNSGGPVFVIRENVPITIGLVTGSFTDLEAAEANVEISAADVYTPLGNIR